MHVGLGQGGGLGQGQVVRHLNCALFQAPAWLKRHFHVASSHSRPSSQTCLKEKLFAFISSGAGHGMQAAGRLSAFRGGADTVGRQALAEAP